MLEPGALVLDAQQRTARWSTPKLLRFLLVALWAGVALVMMASEAALKREQIALRTLGRDTAPSIIAAQRIRADLADLDANAVSSLLGSSSQRAEALQQLERRRSRIVESLIDAAHNITYGDAERLPIVTLIDGLGRYLERWARGRYWYESGDRARSLPEHRAAGEVLQGTLLPAADALDKANRSHLDAVYSAQRSTSAIARAVVVLAGGGLLAALVAAQVLLAARTRRAISLPLLGATLLVAGWLAHPSSTLSASHEALRAAREDAFESIHLLIAARALVCEAHSDQSRLVLDPERAVELQASFTSKLAQLTSQPPPAASGPARRGAGTGLLDRELANITYPGELEAATATVRALAGYAAIAAEVRERVRRGDLAGAAALHAGRAEREASGAFLRVDEALAQTLAINEHAFAQLFDESNGRLGRALPLVPVLALASGVLILLGLRPRLRDYD